MKENRTIQAALNRGQWIINLPVLIIMLGMMSSFLYLGVKKICPIWIVAIGFVLGFSLAWLWWSFMVTRWMLWAFPKVDNVQELRQAAVAASLIWPKGHFFEKTMIISAAQQAQLDQLDAKHSVPTPKLLKTYRTDETIPMETLIYYSKISIILTLLAGLGLCSILIMDLWDKPKLEFKSIMDYFGIAFCVWLFTDSFKQLLNINNPQLIISNKGIWCADYADEGVHLWSDITEENITREYHGKHWQVSLYYNYQNLKKLHDALETYKNALPQLAKIPKFELDHLIEQYQEMEDIHPAWEQYGISEDDVEYLAEIYNHSNKYVELDTSSYNISMKSLQYLLEIYRGRHLQAQKGFELRSKDV
jgi:hypothetical protein